MGNVKKYIEQNWNRTIKYVPQDNGTLIGLPKPFTTPCISGMFQELFYWDTYFTNLGLMQDDRFEQAKNNVDDMLYLVERYGMMPNGSRTYFLNRSQPPFLSQMVKDIWTITRDNQWLQEKAYPALKKEYDFWQSKRQTICGLNCYAGTQPDSQTLQEYAQMLCERFNIAQPTDEETRTQYGYAMLAVAESGWDCTSRFKMEAHCFCPVDLNALLYMLEENMECFAKELHYHDEMLSWQKRKINRKKRMQEVLWDEERNCFFDYNFCTKERGNLLSAAAFYPLFVGMCDEIQAEAVISRLPLIEREYGIACCEEREDLLSLQWDHPNGWACIQYIVVQGLLRYGHIQDAQRIMHKFVHVIEKVFDETGNLWEKYDVCTGKCAASKEYATPPMMGWTAGVYVLFRKMLENK